MPAKRNQPLLLLSYRRLFKLAYLVKILVDESLVENLKAMISRTRISKEHAIIDKDAICFPFLRKSKLDE